MFPIAALNAAIPYPETRTGDTVEDYHGTSVADPYRWLEDDNSAETKAWVSAQNKVTDAYLSKIPQRKDIAARLEKLWNYERIGSPQRYGENYFFTHNTGLQNQSVLKVADKADGEGKTLLDPNTLSPDGTTSLANYSPSEDGKLLAYSISMGGSDWQEILLRDVATRKDLPDHLKWIKFSGISWKKDGSGFFYSRFDEPEDGAALTQKNEFQKLYFHRIGDPQSADTLIYERKDHARWGFGGRVTEDGKHLVIHVSEGTDPKNRIFIKPLDKEESEVMELIPDADAGYDFIEKEGGLFYFHTDLEAPRHRVIAIDINTPARADWKKIIPEAEDDLAGVSSVGGQLIAEYLHHAKSAVKCFAMDGSLIRNLDLPGISSVGGFGGRKEDTTTYFGFTSFTQPGAIYELDLATGGCKVWKRSEVDFDSNAYETKQVFVTSGDGTKVPMFIVHKKGIEPGTATKTLLYGYGGFSISLTPGFSVTSAAWLERGGIYALANLRGGGEYGRDWHLAGTKLRKHNVFDDFIACAEWLQEKGYTSKEKLAIQGGSNGGLLVGACMTQRPDLFGAALPSVGVMDMLRFHKFTIGWAWEKDYGSSESPEEFKALYAYSPLHNLKPGTRYPATLVSTADHDDRVVPAHSFKFVARLQKCQAPDGPPVIIRIATSAGHGAGTALDKVIEKAADEISFLEENLK